MLSGVLNSIQAVKMNIAIMRAFVEIRRVLMRETDMKEQLKQIRERLGDHDVHLNHIYDALENLLNEKWHRRHGMTETGLGLKPNEPPPGEKTIRPEKFKTY